MFKHLYNYQGGNRKINIPSYKKQKAFYEVYKECTFKPELNKKSLGMGQNRKPLSERAEKTENRDDVGTIVKVGSKSKIHNVVSPPRSPKSSGLASVAGKIVPQTLAKRLSTQTNDLKALKERSVSPIPIHSRLYELHNMEKKKRERNEAIKQENMRKEEAK